MDATRFPRPCCGHLTFSEPPGSYDICPVCFWEDDALQLRRPDMRGGANRPSLIESQVSFRGIGAMEGRFRRNVRPPQPAEPRDPGWRPFDPTLDDVEPDAEHGRTPWPDDLTALYYWRPTFWRRRSS